MKQEHFTNIQRAADDFIERVDAIIPGQQKEAETDYLFSDAVKRDRMERRREAAQFAINDGARQAKERATVEVDAMRGAFRRYMTAPADPAQLASLQALLSSGIELTDKEIRSDRL